MNTVPHCRPEPALKIHAMPYASPCASTVEPLFELELELLLSTPCSIVVRARAEFDDGTPSQEAGLVIARRDCVGDRPSMRALYWAALACAARLARCGGERPRQVCCLQARVSGGWVPLVAPVLQEEVQAA